MPKYWLITDRDKGGIGMGRNVSGLSYFVSDNPPLNNIDNWKKVSPKQFRTLLAAAADAFPALPHCDNENQSHVTLLVHGFNVSFDHSTAFYEQFRGKLFDGGSSLGLCVLYDWPSMGSVVGYEPDRAHARECAGDLADILSELFDWLVQKQQDAINSHGDPNKACKAKVSLVAHSMGNYVLQKAMAAAWTRKNQPHLASLLNQLIMVAADVDNDLFDAGAPDSSDGAAIFNLSYRVTSLYSVAAPVRSVAAIDGEWLRGSQLTVIGISADTPLIVTVRLPLPTAPTPTVSWSVSPGRCDATFRPLEVSSKPPSAPIRSTRTPASSPHHQCSPISISCASSGSGKSSTKSN